MTDLKPKNSETETPIEVPPEMLSADVLRSLIESYVLREGTDYGAQEVSLERKVDQVARQLQAGEVKIVFEASTESVTILTKDEFSRRSKPSKQPHRDLSP